MKTLCVAHLVRARNGPDAFRRFLASYLRHGAGAPHRLLVIFKGFRGRGALLEYDRLLADVPHDRIHVRDYGYDIRAYVVAARQTRFDLYCFLNSFSVILEKGWLAKLAYYARGDGSDLVGATGSWVSHLTLAVDNPDFGRYVPLGGGRIELPRALAGVARRALLGYMEKHFDAYPNHHIRTNCFLVARDLLLESAPTRLLSKIDVYKFESGRSGLSCRFKARNRPLLVIGRDGNSYAQDAWPASNTCWQGDQENLLVADNQTMRYQAADLATRGALSRLAWSDMARPPAGVRSGAASFPKVPR